MFVCYYIILYIFKIFNGAKMTIILVRWEKKFVHNNSNFLFIFLLPNEKNAVIFILKSLKN